MIRRYISSEEEKHVNDVCFTLTKYIVGKCTYHQLMRWLRDNTTSKIKYNVLEIAKAINKIQDSKLN